jgi:hypothetical protein
MDVVLPLIGTINGSHPGCGEAAVGDRPQWVVTRLSFAVVSAIGASRPIPGIHGAEMATMKQPVTTRGRLDFRRTNAI